MADASGTSPSSLEQRRIMVDRQVRTFDVTDQIVTGRMLEVPREMFTDESQQVLAYSDLPLDLAGASGPRSRTLLPPLVLARMLQAAEPKATDRVLDIAGGTGYTAALFAGIVADVVAVEADQVLSSRAKATFADLGLTNISSMALPLARLTPDLGPFDIIFVNGCAEDHLSILAAMLAPRGCIIAIVPKPTGSTMAARITGRGDDLSVRPLFDAQAPVIEDFRRAPVFAL